jgi:hypothetical protein
MTTSSMRCLARPAKPGPSAFVGGEPSTHAVYDALLHLREVLSGLHKPVAPLFDIDDASLGFCDQVALDLHVLCKAPGSLGELGV